MIHCELAETDIETLDAKDLDGIGKKYNPKR